MTLASPTAAKASKIRPVGARGGRQTLSRLPARSVRQQDLRAAPARLNAHRSSAELQPRNRRRSELPGRLSFGVPRTEMMLDLYLQQRSRRAERSNEPHQSPFSSAPRRLVVKREFAYWSERG